MSQWAIDPETKAKLLEIQKQNGNNVCVDCGAPSPQWASPKFGIFMCLNCSGVHRGLGVHISFIRSVTMDGFKVSELQRMQSGGNKPWQDFFNRHKDNQLEGRTFEASTIKDRYDSDAGEEWKDRLSARIEGRDYVPTPKTSRVRDSTPTLQSSAAASRSQTPIGSAARTSEASPARSASPSLAGAGNGRKAQNESYFARMGAENASRPADLPPSQGGKFGGFGSEPAGAGIAGSGAGNNADLLSELQKDPVAALTKGFGWLGKNAKTGFDGWVKPNVQKLAETDFTTTARQTAAQLSQTVTTTTKTAADTLSRLVEGDDHDSHYQHVSTSDPSNSMDNKKADFWNSFGATPRGPARDKKDFWDSFGAAPAGPPEEKREFWDGFAAAADGAAGARGAGTSSIGTSAMRKGGGGAGGSGGRSGAVGGNGKDEDWGEW